MIRGEPRVLQEFSKRGPSQRAWRRKSPVESMGKVPVEGLEVLRSWSKNCDISV